jgi:hypothetical protein
MWCPGTRSANIVKSTMNFTNLSITISIIKQAKITILFISDLRICWIDFDATSSDLVALSWISRMVQSASCFIERKSSKVKQSRESRKKRSDGGTGRNTGGMWGPLKKLKRHFVTQKLIGILSKSSSVHLTEWIGEPQKFVLVPQLSCAWHSIPGRCPQLYKNTHRPESNVNSPITINLTNPSITFQLSSKPKSRSCLFYISGLVE